MDFRNIENKYRALPFWSWNDKLNVNETLRQIGIMDEAGLGGFFMHARGGLQTEYMGEEWFENFRASCDEAARRGMYAWAYDEKGWPSGFGGGLVSGRGVRYQEKFLRYEPATEENIRNERTILVKDGRRYFWDVNRYYVDVMDKEVIRTFIEDIYETYYRKFGNVFSGFFTDEPQMSRNGIPWSLVIPDKFSEKYGYDICAHIDELFFDGESAERTRADFWLLAGELFTESYAKQIYEWCTAHGYDFTGHMLLEETLMDQMLHNGAAMPNYEYFTIPGMDWLCRKVYEAPTPMQVGSAAAQTGKRQVLSESFALCGHNVSHAELKGIFEWQAVHGINLLCTHLEGYSLRGIRKRDYPPAVYYQQPWWRDARIFFDFTARLGKVLAEGEQRPTTLVIHPEGSAWRLGCEDEYTGKTHRIRDIDDAFMKGTVRTLERKHVLYHFGDEQMMARLGSVEGARLRVGEMTYEYLVIPENAGLLPSTERLIKDFRRSGGKIVSADEHPINPVCPENRLTYTYRHYDGFDVHYFVNTFGDECECECAVGNLVLDLVTGETKPYDGHIRLGKYESIMLIDDGGERAPRAPGKAYTPLPIEGEWEVAGATYNSLTLDTCDYWFDGELMGRGAYVLDILPRANELRRPVELRQLYRVSVRDVPKTVYLCLETPEEFGIRINGETVPVRDAGYFRDSSFRLIDIAGVLRAGVNEIELTTVLSQSRECYDHIADSWTCEIMKNSLSYDREIEQIYLVGDFGVALPDDITEKPRRAYIFRGQPEIVRSPKSVDVERLDFSGYPEFAGELTLRKKITLGTDELCRKISLYGKGINSVHLSVNGQEVAVRMWGDYTVDISPYLHEGENTLELLIVNNLRNMQGPFHLSGESYVVSPGSFYRESNIFSHKAGAGESDHSVLPHWTANDEYCLVHFGMGDRFADSSDCGEPNSR